MVLDVAYKVTQVEVCSHCGGTKDKPRTFSDDSYSQFPCPFHWDHVVKKEKRERMEFVVENNFPQEMAINRVLDERDRQDRRFPDDRNLTPHQWLRILVEEVGEIAESFSTDTKKGELEDELIQTAAVAIAWLEDIYRQNGKS